MKFRLWSVVLSLSLAAIGCANVSPDRPPTIRYGEEACAHCHMIISEERFAAALTTPTGEAKHFDEVSCLMRELATHSQPTARLWAHDYRSARWLAAREAFFVQSPELATPMGAGIVALATREQATQLSQQVHGRVMTFDELR